MDGKRVSVAITVLAAVVVAGCASSVAGTETPARHEHAAVAKPAVQTEASVRDHGPMKREASKPTAKKPAPKVKSRPAPARPEPVHEAAHAPTTVAKPPQTVAPPVPKCDPLSYAAGLAGTFALGTPAVGDASTDLDTGVVTVSPGVRCDPTLRTLFVHESMHVMQGRIYGGAWPAIHALEPYGGFEINADCATLAAGMPTGAGYTNACTGQQALAGVATAKGVRAPGA